MIDNSNIIETMFKLQNELNIKTNGKEWKSGTSKNENNINWSRCILNEVSEFQNSFQWKHWKATTIKQFTILDKNNAQMELVDIWHFIMSLFMEANIDQTFINEHINKIVTIPLEVTDNIDTLLLDISEILVYNSIVIHKLIRDNDNITLEEHYLNAVDKILNSFFFLVYSLDLTIEDLYKLYLVKNILNRFRQDNGYIDGTYIKIWDGKEDNEVARQILDDDVNLKIEDFYDKLENAYSKIKG